MTDEHPPRECRECGKPAVARLFGRDGDGQGLRCVSCLRDDLLER